LAVVAGNIFRSARVLFCLARSSRLPSLCALLRIRVLLNGTEFLESLPIPVFSGKRLFALVSRRDFSGAFFRDGLAPRDFLLSRFSLATNGRQVAFPCGNRR